ncbi:alpha/beta fold hydrolase [Companilactobacillus insicii]|uniref:alpha/beta fold hydrolase n=1 Tax=Companilactobacillus insicii TaxID=1732567 RepID=UPI000F767FB2|nr:alpha/beta hydrolase [Companilactobacillus insicii]
MKFLTDDNIELNYNVYGTGKPVVLIAGFGGYQEIWQLQIPYLVKMGYQVITYDHRNHGVSQRTDSGLNMSRLIVDLHELIEYLHLNNPLLIGHSMGASVCYGYLAEYENVAAVMGVDQTPKMLNDPTWKYGFMDISLDNYRDKTLHPVNVHETLHGLDSRVINKLNDAKNNYPFNRDDNLPLLFDHITKDWRDVIKNSNCPVMLVAAKESPYYNSDFANVVSSVGLNVTSAVVDNSGHAIMAEAPNAFNQLMRHFVLSNRRYQ